MNFSKEKILDYYRRLRDIMEFEETIHREHGHCIATGTDTRKMVLELYGREEGLCCGKRGSMCEGQLC